MHAYGTGGLGKDIELKVSGNGNAWFSTSFAFNSRVKRDGEWKTEPIWVTLKAFGDQAEHVSHYGAKGTRLLVSGEIQMDKYEKDGQEVERLVLVADEIGLDLRFGLDNG